MKVACYFANSAQYQKTTVAWMISGFAKHGIDAQAYSTKDVVDCDLAVLWGHRQGGIIQRQKDKKAHYLVMERGYIGDRFLWTSLGFDGLNGRARFPRIDDGLARWNKNFQQFFKEWQPRTEMVAVIMGQCRGDSALQGVDFQKWVLAMNAQWKTDGYSTVFRPHPGDPLFRVCGLENLSGDLDDALGVAKIVVTYNSNSGVDAIMAGVPVYAEDTGSMVYDLSVQFFENAPILWDRDRWCAKMAYTQWLPYEIEDGTAWDALKTVYDG